MLFEIGKCYKHITGVRMKILCEAETTQWGNTLIAEEGKHGHGLISVANDIDNPAILDEFHDTLVDRYYQELVDKKIIKTP